MFQRKCWSRIYLASIFIAIAPGVRQGVDPAGSRTLPVRAAQDTQVVRRRMDGKVLVSTALPALRLRVAPPFHYLGHFEFDLKGIAHVERHVFAETRGRQIRRMIVLQFEGFLPSSTEVYRYPIINPIALGGFPYRHNVYVFNAAEAAHSDPGAEPAHMEAFLREQGLTQEEEQIMSRFARIVGDDRRHELIVFYFENLADIGHKLAEVSVNGDLRPEFATLGDSVTQRSLKSFAVLSNPGKR